MITKLPPGKYRVLTVDTEPENLDFVKSEYEKMGYSSGEQWSMDGVVTIEFYMRWRDYRARHPRLSKANRLPRD